MKTRFSDDHVIEIGIDESGRGPLIGRVYAAAVVLFNNDDEKKEDIPFITDSKKMSSIQRAKAEKWIKENVKAYATAYAEPVEIDEINILEATRLAMQRAIDIIENLIGFTRAAGSESNNKKRLIIDGWRWEKKFDSKKYEIQSVVKGDATYLPIAMASILAKEEHDRHIHHMCETYPELDKRYDLCHNMGYGTKKHLEGIQQYGVSEFHRKSFKPCKNNEE